MIMVVCYRFSVAIASSAHIRGGRGRAEIVTTEARGGLPLAAPT